MFELGIHRLFAAAAVATLSLFGANGAQAAVASCPDSATLARTFTLESSPGCYAYGVGNINGNMQDPLLAGATVGGNTFVLEAGMSVIPGLAIVDKSDTVGFPLDGILGGTLAGGTVVGDSVTGTITVGPSTGWKNFILALKVGNNSDPTWAAFKIAGQGSYDFTISPKKGSGLSHTNLYAVACAPGDTDPSCGGGGVGVIPVPAGLPLLLTGLGIIGIVRHRKSKMA